MLLKSKYPWMGEYSYCGDNFTIHGREEVVSIGKFCSIAPNLTIQTGGGHWIDFVSSFPFPAFEEWKPLTKDWVEPELPKTRRELGVTIGNDVWIGINTTIRAGVTIGDGSVIGMGSVVIKDVLPYSIVVGNPAKHLRYRFEEEIRNKLIKIRWWDWEIPKIRENLKDFDDPTYFVEKYGA